jgi:TolB protein
MHANTSTTSRRLGLVLGGSMLLTVCGCATSRPVGLAQTTPPPPLPIVAPPGPAEFVAIRPSAGSRPVNAFGEVDGVTRPATAFSVDAAVQQHSICDEGYDADVCLDPTGRWMAFASTRHSLHSDIYLQRIDGSAVIQLTSDGADDAQPDFSPDGKRIAFASNRSGQWEIYLMDADGKNVQQLSNGPAQKMHPSFSPDGNRLVYCSLSGKSDQWELWVLTLDSGQKRMVGYGLFPDWSPQKGVDRIAFQRARQRGSRWFSLWTVDLQDGEPHRLTEVASASNAALVCPSWNKEGTKLAFTSIVAPGEGQARSGGQDVWIVNMDGSGRQRLTDGLGASVSPFWGPSDRVFFISDRGGKENIWSVGIEPSNTATASAPEHSEPATGQTPPEHTASVGTIDAH